VAAGFSLVELLVVLVVIAVSVAVVAPHVGWAVAKRPPPSPSEAFVARLAQLRDRAILERRMQRSLLQLDAGILIDGDYNVLYEFPADHSLTARTNSPLAVLPCVFMPDGSGCGLDVRVTAPGLARPLRLQVSPITGRVRLGEDPEES